MSGYEAMIEEVRFAEDSPLESTSSISLSPVGKRRVGSDPPIGNQCVIAARCVMQMNANGVAAR
jgi:hypothetical protein